MRRFFSTFLVLWLIWILLTGFAPEEILVGAVAALVLSAFISRYLEYHFAGSLPVTLLKGLFLYLPRFIIELVKANLDVAFRVLNPALPLNPAFVKVPTKLKSPYGRFLLANSITLTPGTLSLDADDDYVYIHGIDVKGNTPEEHQEHVSASFETVLGGMFK